MFLALYTTIMNIGAFVMPLIGVKLADQFGPAPVIVAGGDDVPPRLQLVHLEPAPHARQPRPAQGGDGAE